MSVKEIYQIDRHVECMIHEMMLMLSPDKNIYEWIFRNNSKSLGLVLSKVYNIDHEKLRVCKDFDSLLKSPELMSLITEDDNVMKIIVSSEYIWRKVLSSDIAFEKICESEAAMLKVASTSMAMSALLESKTATEAILFNNPAKNIVFCSTTAMKSILNSEYAQRLFIDTLNNDDMYLADILNYGIVLDSIASHEAVMKEIIQSKKIMEVFIESDAALLALYNNSKVTEPIIAENTMVLNLMRNSNRCEVVSGNSYVYGNRKSIETRIYDSKAFVLDVVSDYTWDDVKMYHGRYVFGNNTITAAFDGKVYVVNKFAVAVFTNSSYEGNSSAAHLGRVSHTIFKLEI